VEAEPAVKVIAPDGVIETELPEIEVEPPETVKPAEAVRAEPETSRPAVASTLPLKVT